MPIELSLEWLFAPARDTVHVSGKLIDWVTFHSLGHDFRRLAATSFVLWFGGWALAAIALAFQATRDQLVVRLAALATFALPLAASPYWVTVSPLQKLEPAVAYHQMLPVVALVLLCLVVVRARRIDGATCAGTAALTAFFSLAYSSGAVCLLLFGATLASLSALSSRSGLSSLSDLSALARRSEPRDRFVVLGLVVGLTAAAVLAVHVALPMQVYDVNPVLESRAPRRPLSLPWERDFWTFLLGLFDRALLSLSIGAAGLVRGGALFASMVASAAALAWLVVRGRLDERQWRLAIALVSLLVSVLGYAALVALGRASFGTAYLEDFDPETRANVYAHSRFFYWWINASLPFAVIAAGIVLGRWRWPRAVGTAACAAAALGVVSALPNLDGWDYGARYRKDAEQVQALIRRDQIEKGRHLAHFQWAREVGAPFADLREPPPIGRGLRRRRASDGVDRDRVRPRGEIPADSLREQDEQDGHDE